MAYRELRSLLFDGTAYIDLAKGELRNARVQNLASAPSSPVRGQLYYDTGADVLYFYNGTSWISTVGAGYTDEQAQDAVGTILTDSATVDFTYNDAGNTITAAVLDSPTLQGQNSAYHRARANHTGTQLAATISDFDTQVRTSRLDQLVAPNADVSLNSHKLTNVTDGVAASDAATFGQVNAILQGQLWKNPVRAATTANGTLATAFANGQVIDGVTLATGDRILLKDQTTASDRGIYTVNASGAPTRATDADVFGELNKATVIISSGTANSGDVYTQTATLTSLSDSQTWTKTGEGNTVYSADESTLTLTGQQFSVKNAGVTGTQLAASVAGNGLTGGAGSALAVGAGTGVSVAADSVAIDTAVVVQKFVGALTGGATSEVVTHNLGTRDVSVTVRNNATPWEEVGVESEATTTNTVTIRAAANLPASYRVIVHG